MRNLLAALAVALVGSNAHAQPVEDLAKSTLAAAGGEAAIPKLFRIKEQLVLGEDPKGKVSTRLSVLEPPDHWWLGKKDRVKADKEPAIFLVWTWTLGSLADPKSKLKAVPEAAIDGKPAYGIEISESITPPLTAYFDKETRKLVRIDWRKDQHKFSDWKDADGFKYPSKCVGYRATGKAWYHSEITEFERLKELPAGLMR